MKRHHWSKTDCGPAPAGQWRGKIIETCRDCGLKRVEQYGEDRFYTFNVDEHPRRDIWRAAPPCPPDADKALSDWARTKRWGRPRPLPSAISQSGP